jgi:hypothetical protein
MSGGQTMTDVTPQATGGLSRRTLLRSGLLVGGATAAGIATPALTGVAQAYSYSTQTWWTYCDNCLGLFYGPNQASSYCPSAPGSPVPHVGYSTPPLSWDYLLFYDWSQPPASVQTGWNYCNQCQGLFYGPNQGNSYCPAGHFNGNYLQHQNYYEARYLDTYDYGLYYNSAPPGYQGNWNWCRNCQGLWYTTGPDNNNCPAGGLHATGARNYFLSWIPRN